MHNVICAMGSAIGGAQMRAAPAGEGPEEEEFGAVSCSSKS